MSLAKLSRTLLGRSANAIIALCHDLIGPLGNPYRPGTALHARTWPEMARQASPRELAASAFATKLPQDVGNPRAIAIAGHLR